MTETKYFKEPVTIKCKVNGQNLIARIIGELDLPVNFGFVIEYSDGITLQTEINERGRFNVDEYKYRPYIEAIEKDLRSFILVKSGEWYKFEVGEKANPLLVWVSVDNDNSKRYSVYFDGDYQFHLLKITEGWKNNSIRVDSGPVDQKIANLVAVELEKKIVY